MTLSIIKTYSSDDIDKLNEELWRTLYIKGNELTFGDAQEPKKAREIFAVVQVYGKALKRLYNGDVPEGWLFRGAANREYVNMLKDPLRGEQPYTYGQRLHLYPLGDGLYIDQLENARARFKEDLESGIQNNRNCGVIWNPKDIKLKSPACFQWYQLRKSEKNKASLRLLFRSHAYDNGVFPNLGAIIKVFTDEVIEPEGGILEEVILVSVSAEIEYSNFDMIEAVVGNIPEHIRRLLK